MISVYRREPDVAYAMHMTRSRIYSLYALQVQ